MIAGQMLDLYAEKLPADTDGEKLIKHIEEMKTGRLISYACEAGAILGGADTQQRQALAAYARGIGIAFQIADDILDVDGEQEENARQIAKQLIEQAKEALSIFGSKAENLKALAQYIIDRNY